MQPTLAGDKAMEIFGFICGVLIISGLTLGWVFIMIFDGAFGKRDIPLYMMACVFVAILMFWQLLISNSPFTVIVN